MPVSLGSAVLCLPLALHEFTQKMLASGDVIARKEIGGQG